MATRPIWETYSELEEKFEKACGQLKIITCKIADVQLRYDRANDTNRRSFRYSLRIQLSQLEAVRNMFYEYAKTRAEELDKLKQQLVRATAEHSDDEGLMDMEDEDDEDD